MEDNPLDLKQTEELKFNGENLQTNPTSDLTILESSNEKSQKDSKLKIGLTLTLLVLLIIGVGYQGIHHYYAKKSFNTAISSLRNGDLEAAYPLFIDTSATYPHTEAGSLAKQYAEKIEEINQLSSEIDSKSKAVSFKKLFIKGTLKTIEDYLETANSQMCTAHDVPMINIAQDSIWINQSKRYADFVNRLSFDDQQYLSSKDYDMIKSAFACYALAPYYLIQFSASADLSHIADFTKAVDLFNNNNYPYVHNLINTLKSEFEKEQFNLDTMDTELQSLKHDLDSASML